MANQIPNHFKIELVEMGFIKLQGIGKEPVILSQEYAANLAANIVGRLENDAYLYFKGLAQRIEANKGG